MAPVWEEAALAPAAVVPDLIMITGFSRVTLAASARKSAPCSTFSM
jgi:hypothetical protein